MEEKEEQRRLLEGDAAKERIEQYLEAVQHENVCTLFLISIDHFERLKEDLGIDAGVYIVQCVGRILLNLFQESDIVGRMEEDMFAVCVSGELTEDFIYQKTNTICERLQLAVRGMGTYYEIVTVSAGIYITHVENITFQALYDGAMKSLHYARKRGDGGFYIERNLGMLPDGGQEKAPGPVNAIRLHTLLEYMDGGVCLLELERNEITLVYASPGFYQMTGSRKELSGLPCSLEKMGIHPDYLKNYKQALLAGVNSWKPITHIHRIRGKHSLWIWRQVRAVRLRYPDDGKILILELSTDISELMERESQLRESNERLRVAFGQTPDVMWEVDLKKRTYGIYDINSETCQDGTRVGDFPDALLENGYVHPKSSGEFQNFAKEMLEGSRSGVGNFIIRDSVNNCYEWMALSYHMIYDADGNPVKAIGIQEKLPDITGRNSSFMLRRPLPESLRHQLLARMQANLTADSVEYLWMEGRDQTAWTWGKSCSDILESGETRLFIQGEGSEFRKRFKRENLLKAYQNGEIWSSCEFRRISPDGSIRWMIDMINLQYDPVTDAVYMFACFFDVQQRKDWERLLPQEVDRCRKNGLYSRQTAEQLSELIVASEKGICAMACIGLGGMRCQMERGTKEHVRDFIKLVLSYTLGPDCIAGDYEENILMVFFPEAESEFAIKRRIEDAMAYARTIMSDVPELEKIRFVAGVVIAQSGEADAEIMRIQASYLCSMWKNSAMDCVVFPTGDEDWGWISRKSEIKETVIEEEQTGGGLDRDTQDVVFRCVTSMLTAGSLEESVGGVLKYIGQYYKADRIYILSLSSDSEEVTMQYEWLGNGKYSIQQIMSGMKIDRIPLLGRCMKKRKPMVMKSTGNRFIQKNTLREIPWSYIAYPLGENEKVTGFICVENAQEHGENLTPVTAIIPYLFNEYKRFHQHLDQKEASIADTLSQIPNLKMYTDVVYSMSSDVYSSMGAVALDIPDYSAINGNFSFEYGREMLFFIVKTLSSLFAKGFIFRTWDAEFVVLFPNTILEVFTGRCARLRTMLQRRYPHQIRIGYTWSDGIFSSKNLVKEAKAIMRCEEVRETLPDRSGLLKGNWLYNENSSISENSYVLYLQPKIDMRDGSLMGAEALVRGINEKGEIVSPAQFIEKLETDGSIRELDYFMLENVLSQLSRWKIRGMRPVQVSVNISRHTLFNPTVLASILAIYSHYPDVPADQVELEITETAGDMEKSTLERIVNNFRECGIGFELDDFGSRYANLSIFSNIKFNTIKLDRSLVNDLPDNEISRIMVENIASICKNFGMLCVAEGVENQRQKEILLDAGCIYGQGYYYARPMPVWRFEETYLQETD